MIKANELRIGNYIYDNLKNWVIKMHSANGIVNVESKPHEYSPIELSEEWLLKAGFKKIGRIFYHDSFWACELSSHNELRFEDLDNLYIKYVHQLQNLYFCFCGEELVFSTEP